MIRTLTAFTTELDDVGIAVREILDQLDLKHNKLTNAIGIVNCFSEFIGAGIVKALSDALPFDIVGTTTLACAVNAEMGELMLTLSVLTSDDVDFSTAVTGSLAAEQDAPIREAFRKAAGALPRKPAMLLTFMSLMFNVGGDTVLRVLNEATGNVPNFGTISVDHTPDYHTSRVILNGEAYTDTMVIVVMCGDVRPSFLVASIPDSKIMKRRALITESNGNVLISVNGVPVIQYMETIGLARGGRLDGISAIPFIVDYNDGTKPVARSIFAMTPEGYAVCGGDLPVNATLSVGSIDMGDVLETTRRTLETALAARDNAGLLMYSCLSRSLTLGVDATAEMEAVRDIIGEAAPYQFCYSGGEICPVYDADGRLVNRFHNDTIIVCAF